MGLTLCRRPLTPPGSCAYAALAASALPLVSISPAISRKSARSEIRTLLAPQPHILPKTQRPASFRLWLRETTRAQHVELDRQMAALDLAAMAGYESFLRIHIEAMQFLRCRFRAEDRLEFENLIRCGRRDLGESGENPTPPEPCLQPWDTAHAWGIGYVIRGSRLGAEVLRRRVPSDFRASFLGYTMKLPWAHFVAQLDEFGAQTDAQSQQSLLAGARAAFAVYTQLGLRTRQGAPAPMYL